MNQVKVTERVQKQLFELQDLQYRDFQAKLLPTIEKETIIGVRMPVLRKFAKGYGKTEEAKEFLKILPHQYLSLIHISEPTRLRQLSRMPSSA